MLLALPALVPAEAAANEPPRVSRIASDLRPPINVYSVEARDPDGDALTFTWSLSNAGACTFLSQDGDNGVWRHDDPEACPHDAPSHPGTITVVVTDGHWDVVRVYDGGSAPHSPGTEAWDSPDYEGGPGGSTVQHAGEDDDGDDPNDAPPPVLFGEEIECAATNVVGALQPVQAVWQDDPVFPDIPTKRLTALDDRTWRAELDLVDAKPTLLFGTRDHDWNQIRMAGTLVGYVSVPTEVRFTLEDGSGSRVVHRHDAGELPIRGDCVATRPFEILIPTTNGVPAETFTVTAGEYTVTMELVEKATDIAVPGTQVQVSGSSVTMPNHRVYFVPVMLSDYVVAEAQSLVAAAKRVEPDYESEVPDFFPLPPGSVTVVTRPIERDLRDVLMEAWQLCDELRLRTRDRFLNCEAHAVRARVEAQMRAGGWLMGTGAGTEDGRPERIVIWVRDIDMDVLGRDGAQAFAPSTKTVFVRDSSDHWDVAHEIVHTLPRHLWSARQMAAACDHDYHNKPGWANGFRITHGGADHRERHDRTDGLMGAVSAAKRYWVEQCTFWHLLTALKSRVDPPMFAVRGVVARPDSGPEIGLLDRGFTVDGIPDLDESGAGAYAIVLRDAAGDALATYGFDLSFEDDRDEALPIVSFGFGVPRHPDAATVELVGPDGALDTRAVSANAPTVTVRAPADRAEVALVDGALAVAWSGADLDGDALTYAAFVSPDGGASWFDVAVDTNATNVTMDARLLGDGGGERLLRVVATDGVLSGEHVVAFTLPAGASVAGEGRTPAPGAALVALALIGVAWAARRPRRGA